METAGYFAAIVIGIILGLIGGGGSILTLPVLIYMMGIGAVTATAYSLFIVGISALVGSIHYFKQKQIDFRTAILFASPALITVYLTRRFILPAIPDPLSVIDDMVLGKDLAIILLFSLLMLLSSFSMIRANHTQPNLTNSKNHYILIFSEGVFVGVLTGLVGAGGGFLIVPALVVWGKLPMKKAVGTSLLIIAIKSLIGFIGDIQNYDIDWLFIIPFAFFTVSGILIGGRLSKRISAASLKPAFGWFVLFTGTIIILKEIFF